MLDSRHAAAWEPILEGRLADQSRAAAREIAEDFLAGSVNLAASGELALFWAYAAAAFDDDPIRARYDEESAALVARIERGEPGGLHLYGGLAGAAWTLAHIAEADCDSAELLAAADRTLAAALSVGRWRSDYDLIGGLTGYGVYFLERLLSGSAAPTSLVGLDRVVRQLEALAERSESGRTWHTAPGLLPGWQRQLWPQGYYNLGVAHGVPGVVALLGRIAALPDAHADAGTLCADALRWTRAQRPPGGFFPVAVSRGDPAGEEVAPRRPRTSWCYGDAGVAAALWSSAVRTGAPADEWRELAATCASRPVDQCHISDAGLCHGAIGLAHLFNRFYQASRDPLFRTASCAWFERGLAMRRPGRGIAGFLAHTWDPDTGEIGWRPAAGLLEGAAGIGLALLAGLGSEEPGWDRLLLCDLPC